MTYAQRHIKRFRPIFQNSHRTTIRVEKDRWLLFKKQCQEMSLTTCFIIRSLIEKWLEATYSEKKLFTRTRKKAKYVPRHKQYGWVYDRELQSLKKVDEKGRYLSGML